MTGWPGGLVLSPAVTSTDGLARRERRASLGDKGGVALRASLEALALHVHDLAPGTHRLDDAGREIRRLGRPGWRHRLGQGERGRRRQGDRGAPQLLAGAAHIRRRLATLALGGQIPRLLVVEDDAPTRILRQGAARPLTSSRRVQLTAGTDRNAAPGGVCRGRAPQHHHGRAGEAAGRGAQAGDQAQRPAGDDQQRRLQPGSRSPCPRPPVWDARQSPGFPGCGGSGRTESMRRRCGTERTLMSPLHVVCVAALLIAFLTWIFWSIKRHPSLDRGDGMGRVVIAAPRPVRLFRVLGFLGTMVIFAVIVVAVRPQIAHPVLGGGPADRAVDGPQPLAGRPLRQSPRIAGFG